MAMTDQATRVAPYVEELLDDEHVRKNIRRAVDASREAYGRARGTKASKALKDRKVQRRIQDAMQAVGEVASGIARGPQKRKRARRARALAGVAIGGGGVVLALNADARRKALALFAGADGGAAEATAPMEERGRSRP